MGCLGRSDQQGIKVAYGGSAERSPPLRLYASLPSINYYRALAPKAADYAFGNPIHTLLLSSNYARGKARSNNIR
jgi:hypothetical protein